MTRHESVVLLPLHNVQEMVKYNGIVDFVLGNHGKIDVAEFLKDKITRSQELTGYCYYVLLLYCYSKLLVIYV